MGWKKKGIVDGQIEAAEKKRWLVQRMNLQSQHVILKKLNKEKFLASRENDVVSGLTQIVSGLNARGAICWFVANFMKIVWKLYMFVKNMLSAQTWGGDDVTCLSFFLRILKFSANSKLVKKRFSAQTWRGDDLTWL